MENDLSNFPTGVKQKAEEIFQIIKSSNCTPSKLDNTLPFGSEVVNVVDCLVYMLKDEIQQDKNKSEDFRQYITGVTNFLQDCLKDNHVTENERTNILGSLDNLGKYYSNVEQERIKQAGKNKRAFAGILGGFAAFVLAIFGINRYNNRNEA